MNVQELGKLIDTFLENQEISNIKIKFNKYVEITAEEYEKIVGKYDSSNAVIDNGVIIEQFSFDEENTIVKISFEYVRFDNILRITEVLMWREEK